MFSIFLIFLYSFIIVSLRNPKKNTVPVLRGLPLRKCPSPLPPPPHLVLPPSFFSFYRLLFNHSLPCRYWVFFSLTLKLYLVFKTAAFVSDLKMTLCGNHFSACTNGFQPASYLRTNLSQSIRYRNI